MFTMRTGLLAALLLAASSLPALAHADPGRVANGFAAGAVHPLLGLDHLLAMLAVGLIGAQVGGRALGVVPGAFLGGMILGGIGGLAGSQSPFVEYAIAASLISFGIIIALNRKTAIVIPALLAMVFGAVHGHAHGMELPLAVSPAYFVTGFLLATTALTVSGVLLGRRLLGRDYGRAGLRWSGAAIAATGVILAIMI